MSAAEQAAAQVGIVLLVMMIVGIKREACTGCQQQTKSRSAVGLGKDFKKKKRTSRSNGFSSKTKRDIVMGPEGKMVVTHRRETNALLTKIGTKAKKSEKRPFIS